MASFYYKTKGVYGFEASIFAGLGLLVSFSKTSASFISLSDEISSLSVVIPTFELSFTLSIGSSSAYPGSRSVIELLICL